MKVGMVYSIKWPVANTDEAVCSGSEPGHTQNSFMGCSQQYSAIYLPVGDCLLSSYHHVDDVLVGLCPGRRCHTLPLNT